MRIEQIGSNLTRIELVDLVHMDLIDKFAVCEKFTFVKEHKNIYEFNYRGNFSELVHVIELVNKIKIYNYELNRILTTHI